MSVEMLFSVIAAIGAITAIIINWYNVHKKGVSEATELYAQKVSSEVKLDLIYTEVKEIKQELKLKEQMTTDHSIKLSEHDSRITALEKKIPA
ncbi:MAG: hypothetical protein LBC65_05295 [Oscillospiraceae bacterium]|nr:hypothetical protein [Oscillospiraceae bacterium]